MWTETASIQEQRQFVQLASVSIEQFTPSQYAVYSNPLAHIDRKSPVLIHGGAGTGKSFLLDTLCAQFEGNGLFSMINH